METNNIKTLHDLADMLENAAKVLRALPDSQLAELSQPFAKAEAQERSPERNHKRPSQAELADLATRLPTLEKGSGEAEIKTLTVESIRQLATQLGIRMPSKLNKSQAIDMLLEQVFDIPAGQELIRTFHRRNSP